jgi:hypothetical protein
MILKPITPLVEIPVIGSDISLATVVSVLNNSGAPCQIRIDNGEAANDQPSIALATGERATIAKHASDEIFAEDLTGTSVTDVFATKIAYGN